MKASVFDRVPFTFAEATRLSSIIYTGANSQIKYVVDNAQDILLRVNTSSLSGNVDSFVMETSAFPNEEIVYTASIDVVNLTKRDGGFF